jgi:hypothetical protein
MLYSKLENYLLYKQFKEVERIYLNSYKNI